MKNNIISKKRFSKRKLPHFELPGDLTFITISNVEGIYLESCERDLIFSAVKYYDTKLYRLAILVVMPDHTHMAFETLRLTRTTSTSAATAVQRIKSFTTYALRKTFRAELHHLWIDDYFDKTISDNRGYFEVRHYLRSNPVKAGLCKHFQDYPWYYENSERWRGVQCL